MTATSLPWNAKRQKLQQVLQERTTETRKILADTSARLDRQAETPGV